MAAKKSPPSRAKAPRSPRSKGTKPRTAKTEPELTAEPEGAEPDVIEVVGEVVPVDTASDEADGEESEEEEFRDEDDGGEYAYASADDADGEPTYEGDGDADDDGLGAAADDEAEGDGGRGSSRALRPLRSGGKDSGTSLARLDPLQAYMREVQKHPLLSSEDERALAIRYVESGDLDAAARLVTANLRLVVKLAYEYRRAYRNMMDLVQEGNMGLMQAVKKYDPYRGVKLSSYAAWWIRAYMLRYILANWRMVKLGTTQAQRKLFFNLSKEKARLSAMGIEPTNAEIAKRLDVTESEVEEMDRRLSRGDASLDTPVDESDGRQIARVELLPGDDMAPDLATEGAELGLMLREHLDEFKEGLSGKDLVIFEQRLVADEPRTLQELGTEFGVSRERVRQLEARLTKKLRTFLSARLGDAVEIGD